jgi:hypothetical protein
LHTPSVSQTQAFKQQTGVSGSNSPFSCAYEYVDRGLPILPVCPPDHNCTAPGKVPVDPRTGRHMRDWANRAAWTSQAVEDYEARAKGRKMNIGLPVGSISGLLAVDIDDPRGEAKLRELAAGRDIPVTWEYTTGRGRRLLYRIPAGLKIESRKFDVEGKVVLEFLGDGHQVVLPPSRHANGTVYRWTPGCPNPWNDDLALVPDWLLALVTAANGRARTQKASEEAGGPKNEYQGYIHTRALELGKSAARSASESQNGLTTEGLLVVYSDWVKVPAVDPARAPAASVDLFSLANSEEAARRLLGRAGVRYRGGNHAFRCILPGHDERRPSASIWRDKRDYCVYRDFHQRGKKKAYSLTEVYAWLKTGQEVQLGQGEMVLWACRMLTDLKLLDPRYFPQLLIRKELASDAPANAQRAWDSIMELWVYRLLYDPDVENMATPLSGSFLERWAGLTPKQAKYARDWLVRNQYLRRVPATKGKRIPSRSQVQNLYLPGPAAFDR